jgi:hypothetical protein
VVPAFHSRELDPLLRPYFEPADDAAAEPALEALIAGQAAPLVRRVVSVKFRGAASIDARAAQEIDDVCNDVLLQLVRRLRCARLDLGSEPIASFREYVAIAAYRGFDAYLRVKHPERHQLRNRVQYVMRHDPHFFLRKDDNDEWQCGLAAWNDCPRRVATGGIDELARSTPGIVVSQVDMLHGVCLTNALDWVLTTTGSPVRLETLTTYLFKTSTMSRNGDLPRIETLPDPAPAADTTIEQQSYLRALWAEVLELSAAQRMALLLNLRSASGNGVISLFPLLGVATISEIARAVGRDAASFAAIWNELPWDDRRIAAAISSTRQQVINFRKSARQRLKRRMRMRDSQLRAGGNNRPEPASSLRGRRSRGTVRRGSEPAGEPNGQPRKGAPQRGTASYRGGDDGVSRTETGRRDADRG